MGLVEGAEEVFAAGEIDAGFATNGGVDLGEEGGGDLDDRNAPHEDRREETAHVATDAAAEGDDDAGPVGATGEHLVGEGFDDAEALIGFAAGIVEHLETVQLGGVELMDVGGGNDENLAGLGGQKFADLRANAVLDGTGISLSGSGDNVGRH